MANAAVAAAMTLTPMYLPSTISCGMIFLPLIAAISCLSWMSLRNSGSNLPRGHVVSDVNDDVGGLPCKTDGRQSHFLCIQKALQPLAIRLRFQGDGTRRNVQLHHHFKSENPQKKGLNKRCCGYVLSTETRMHAAFCS